MSVDKTTENNEKLLGGITGKGFMPGESGNPDGRPPRSFSIKDAIARFADSIPEDSDKPRHELLADLVWKKALEGDRWSIQFVTEHKEGKPHQSQSIEVNNNESPFERFQKNLESNQD